MRSRFAGLAAALVLLLIACGRPASFEVMMQDSSMEPTFTARTAVRFRSATTADRGEVIAFEYPFDYPRLPRRELIARVIAIGGDEVELGPDGVRVNGQLLSEPYAKNRERLGSGTLAVPAGTYFVLGDDRANQRDSRWWGPLPADKLLGVLAG